MSKNDQIRLHVVLQNFLVERACAAVHYQNKNITNINFLLRIIIFSMCMNRQFLRKLTKKHVFIILSCLIKL